VPIDFVDVRGQEAVKRAIVVAAAGMHNLLMLGRRDGQDDDGEGAAGRVASAGLPEEAMEVTRIYSAAGQLPPGEGADHDEAGAIAAPYRESARDRGRRDDAQAGRDLAGASRGAVPGRVAGVSARMCWRRCDSRWRTTSSRSRARTQRCEFPASFMLIAAMNPTPKGDMSRPVKSASGRDGPMYLSRLSGPLLDRIDIHVEAPAVPWKQLSAGLESDKAPRGTSSAQMRERVLAARKRQTARQGGVSNARLSGRSLDKLAPMTEGARAILGQAMAELGLSRPRVRQGAARVANHRGPGGGGRAHGVARG
jgi:magnesium chelatase family protein